jgi:hypothetical protein
MVFSVHIIGVIASLTYLLSRQRIELSSSGVSVTWGLASALPFKKKMYSRDAIAGVEVLRKEVGDENGIIVRYAVHVVPRDGSNTVELESYGDLHEAGVRACDLEKLFGIYRDFA